MLQLFDVRPIYTSRAFYLKTLLRNVLLITRIYKVQNCKEYR
jgi:hypothetical protein